MPGFVDRGNRHDTVFLQLQWPLLEAARAHVRNAELPSELSRPHAATLAALRALGLVRQDTSDWLPAAVGLGHPRGRPDGAPCQPRLLAAVRALCAGGQPQLLHGVTLRALGAWTSILTPAHEVGRQPKGSGLRCPCAYCGS